VNECHRYANANRPCAPSCKRSLIRPTIARSSCTWQRLQQAFLGRLRDTANTLDLIERQRIVRLIVKEILIGGDNIVIRRSIPIASTPPSSGGQPAPSRSDGGLPAQTGNYLLRSGSNYGSLRGTARSLDPVPILFHGCHLSM